MVLRDLMNGRLKLYLAVSAGNLLALTVGMSLSWSSPILEKLKVANDDNPLPEAITDNQGSWIGSLLPLGAAVGTLLAGYVQDRIGKKYTLMLIAIPFVIAYFMAAFAKVVALFFVVRFFAGLSVGSVFAVLPIYIAEVSDVAVRGMLGAFMNNFMCFGMLVSYSLGPYLPIMWFNIIEVVVPIAMVLFFYFVPDSPYYLIAKSKRNEAEKSLMFFRSKSAQDVQSELKEIETAIESSKGNTGNFFDIFRSKATIKAFVISMMLCNLSQLCGINIVLFYTQDIFESSGSTLDSAIPPIIMAGVQYIGSFITPMIVDRWGRKFLLMFSAIGMIIAEVPLGVYFHLKDHDHNVDSISWLPLVTLIIFIITYNSGFGPLAWTVMAEVFPSNVKGVATSFAACSSFLVSFALSYLYNTITQSIGIGGAFWICSGFGVIAFIFVLVYVPETKGRSFQEIQDILNS